MAPVLSAVGADGLNMGPRRASRKFGYGLYYIAFSLNHEKHERTRKGSGRALRFEAAVFRVFRVFRGSGRFAVGRIDPTLTMFGEVAG